MDGERWTRAFAAVGASQCGFCTPGIIVRLAASAARAPLVRSAVDQALLAHLCRCTGWQTIREAALGFDLDEGSRRDAAVPRPKPVPHCRDELRLDLAKFDGVVHTNPWADQFSV